jgi:hypothetical protein
LARHDVLRLVTDAPPTEEEKAQIRQRLQALGSSTMTSTT